MGTSNLEESAESTEKSLEETADPAKANIEEDAVSEKANIEDLEPEKANIEDGTVPEKANIGNLPKPTAENIREYAEPLKEYLRSQNVREEIIGSFDFSLTNKGNIQILVRLKVPREQKSAVLQVCENGFHPVKPLPTGWLKDPECNNVLTLSRGKCEELKDMHPQGALMERLCVTLERNGATFLITPKEGLPVTLKTFLRFSQKWDSLSKGAKNKFLRSDLITGVDREVETQAASLICKYGSELKKQICALAVPSSVMKREKISSLPEDDGTDSVLKGMKHSATANVIQFSYNNITLDFCLPSGIFSEPKSSYENLLKRLINIQKEIAAAETLCDQIRQKAGENYPENFCTVDLSKDCLKCFVKVQLHHSVENFDIISPADEDSINHILSLCDQAILEDLAADKEEEDYFYSQVRTSQCYGSLLAVSIISILRSSKDRGYVKYGLSQTQLISIAREGKKETFSGGMYSGSFKFLPEDYIKGCITDLNSFHAITTRWVFGQYKRYEIYGLGDEKQIDLITKPKKETAFADYTDIQWLSALQTGGVPSDWEDRMCLLDHPEVYCVRPDLFLKVFKDAPDSVAEYIRMGGKLEKDRIKRKLYRTVLKSLEARSGEKIPASKEAKETG